MDYTAFDELLMQLLLCWFDSLLNSFHWIWSLIIRHRVSVLETRKAIIKSVHQTIYHSIGTSRLSTNELRCNSSDDKSTTKMLKSSASTDMEWYFKEIYCSTIKWVINRYVDNPKVRRYRAMHRFINRLNIMSGTKKN